MRNVYESLREAARKPVTEESSYFVNPLTNQLEKVKLADFEEEKDSSKRRGCSWTNVYLATYNNSRFAIKKLTGLAMDSRSDGDRPTKAFEREMTFLRKTTDWKCDNIVKFHGFIRTGSTARIILERLDKDLSEVIDSLNKSGIYQRMTEESRDIENIGYIILRDISNGLRYIHGCNSEQETFMHRDVKASNIMVKCQEHRFALIDFGTTKEITVTEENKFHSVGAGQAYYEAPECLEYKPQYCESCDIWSLGITMIKFVTGKHPIWDEASDKTSTSNQCVKDNEIHRRIRGKDYDGNTYEWPIGLTSDFLSQDFKNVINRCVNRNMSERPSAQDIFNIAGSKVNSMDMDSIKKLFSKFFGD